MADRKEPLLIKRYASRRLYNTETSDYVTLEDISGFIRGGREVQIVDLKSGDDLTRQYLLQIIAEHESRGENVLPLNVLTDLVRSYTTDVTSAVPQFLAQSFEMFRDGQEKMMQGLGGSIPGLGAVQAQQEAFVKAMTGGMGSLGAPWPVPTPEAPAPKGAAKEESREGEDLNAIKKQLSELQDKLSKLT